MKIPQNSLTNRQNKIVAAEEAVLQSDSDHPHIQLAVRVSMATITLLIAILAWRLFFPEGLWVAFGRSAKH